MSKRQRANSPSGVPGGPNVTVKQLRSERQKLLSEHFGYSNDSNPFGDKTLAEPFVWKKKNILLQAAGNKTQATASALLHSSIVKVQEIKSVKKRREEREAEEMLLLEQREQLQRERERERFDDYFEKEEVFHRIMQIQKTDIRAQQKREQPIDYFIKTLRLIHGEKLENHTLLNEAPHEVFLNFNSEALSVNQIENLLSDIKLHIGVNTTPIDEPYQDFWEALKVLSAFALEEAKKRESVIDNLKKDNSSNDIERAAKAAQLLAAERHMDTGLSCNVLKQVDTLLCNQSLSELDSMQLHVVEKLKHKSGDLSFWETVSNRIPYYQARTVCLTYHHRAKQISQDLANAHIQYINDMVKAKEALLNQQKNNTNNNTNTTTISNNSNNNNTNTTTISNNSPHIQSNFKTEGENDPLDNLIIDNAQQVEIMKKSAMHMAKLVEKDLNPNADGSFSPELEPYGDIDEVPVLRGEFSPLLYTFDEFRDQIDDVLDPIVDTERRELHRHNTQIKEHKKRMALAGCTDTPEPNITEVNDVSNINMNDPANKTMSYEEFVKKEQKNASPDEQVMASSAEQLIQQHYTWQDKYRPRKPRFFNRVKTGYYWTKYNTTHYDFENPPPKSVQGYKFNIFYPDLIDKTKTPTWTLEPSDTEDNTIIIRFHAGPPYEDIAFKILNREWNLDRSRGFRNMFDRGIMQLYFSFKKFVYRR